MVTTNSLMSPRALGYSIKNSDISGWDSTFAKLFVKGTSDFSNYQKNNVYILVYNVDIYVKNSKCKPICKHNK